MPQRFVATALAQARDSLLATTQTKDVTLEHDQPWQETAIFEAALSIINQCPDRKHTLIRVEMHVILSAC